MSVGSMKESDLLVLRFSQYSLNQSSGPHWLNRNANANKLGSFNKQKHLPRCISRYVRFRLHESGQASSLAGSFSFLFEWIHRVDTDSIDAGVGACVCQRMSFLKPTKVKNVVRSILGSGIRFAGSQAPTNGPTTLGVVRPISTQMVSSLRSVERHQKLSGRL